MTLRTLVARQWARRPVRAVATVASVALAVGAIVATWAAAGASRAGYRRLAEAVGGPPLVDVIARDGGRFNAAGVPPLADIPGVRAVVPLVSRPTLLRAGGGRVRDVAVGVDARRLVAAGLLPLDSGEPCSADDEIVLDAGLAAGLGVGVGDEVLLFAGLRIKRMIVTGIAATESLRRIADVGGAVVNIRTLAALTPQPGAVDRIRIVLHDGAARSAVRRAVRERLPESLLADVPAGVGAMAEDVMHAANLGLDFVTVLTAAMAWFIVGNAMLMNVTERQRGLALIRLMGATGGTIRRLVVGEAAVLGAVGAALGAAGGLVAARPIAAGISRALDMSPAAFVVDPRLVAAAVAAGIGGAVVAAWWPARAAAAVDLLEGLAGTGRPPPPVAAVRPIVVVATLVAAAVVVLAVVTAGWLPPRAAVAASVCMLVAFVTATAVVLGPIAATLGALVPRRWRTETSLAIGQITRRSVRTALTSGVLVVAVTNGIGLGHAIRDNVDDIRGWFGRALRADWILTPAGAQAGGGPVGGRVDVAAVRGIPGVERVEGIGIAGGRVAGDACVVIARDMPDDEPLPVPPVSHEESAVRAALARGEAVAGTLLARRTGIRPGDEVVVDVLGRSTKVRVAALVVDYTSGGGSLTLRSDAAARLLGLGAESMLLVRATPGRADELQPPLAAFAREHGLVARSFSAYRRQVDGMVDGVVRSLWAILALGFAVGSLGVANTVTMNVVEQTRSLGLLRAVGMTGRQVTRMIVLQSAAIGAAGGLIGLVGGLTTSAFIQAASQPLLGHPIRFTFRPDIVAGTLAASLAVSILAACLPARRAARLDVLDAIRLE